MRGLKRLVAAGATLALAIGGLVAVSTPAASASYCELSAWDYQTSYARSLLTYGGNCTKQKTAARYDASNYNQYGSLGLKWDQWGGWVATSPISPTGNVTGSKSYHWYYIAGYITVYRTH